MDRTHTLAALRTHGSPFATQAAPVTAWSARPPDVPLINGHAVDGILGLLRHLATHPDQPVACLLEGDVGAGKTHVIGTICQRIAGTDGAYSFAEVKPLLNAKRPLKHLLAAVVTNLNQRPPGDGDLTQLDRITARITAKFLRRTYEAKQGDVRAQAFAMAADIEAAPAKLWNVGKNEPKWGAISSMIKNWLVGETPQVSSKVLKVFLQYAVQHKRSLVIEWLKGESLDEEDLAQLGLKHDEGEREIEAVESRAADTLLTLGHLLRYDRPLVVCFDQLESLEEHESTEKIRAFAHMVQFLFNTVPGMMLVTSVRGEKWTEMRGRIDAAALQRIESSPFRLKACTKDWALALIRSRLATLPLPADAPPMFPFDTPAITGKLDEALSAGTLSARLVLQKAHRLWTEHVTEVPPKPVDPREVLESWVKEETAEILASPEQHPPDESVLTEALRLQLLAPPAALALKACTFLNLKVDRKYVDLVIQLHAGEHAPRIAVLVDNTLHASAVGTSFRHGGKLKEAGQVDSLLFVRDGRRELPAPPKWKATNELRAAFEKGGGRVFALELAHVARWAAVVYLHQAVLAGDVTTLDAGGTTLTLTKADFDEYMRRDAPLPRFEEMVAFCQSDKPKAAPVTAAPVKAAPVTGAPTGADWTAELREATRAILAQCPAKLMKASRIVRELPIKLQAQCKAQNAAAPDQALVAAIAGYDQVQRFGPDTDAVLALKHFA